jgi:hypothetical protein
MELIVRKLNIVMCPKADEENGYEIRLVEEFLNWYIGADSIVLGSVVVSAEVEIPGILDLTKLAVKTLKQRQSDIQAEAQKKIVELQGKINKLTTLTHEETI